MNGNWIAPYIQIAQNIIQQQTISGPSTHKYIRYGNTHAQLCEIVKNKCPQWLNTCNCKLDYNSDFDSVSVYRISKFHDLMIPLS